MRVSILSPGEHPIAPVTLYEVQIAQEFSARLFDEGVYVAGFFYPVLPK
jgi:glycine C-acetyltransferase